MKRYALALLATASLVGCQSPSGLFGMGGPAQKHGHPASMAHQGHYAAHHAPRAKSQAVAASGDENKNPDIVQASYNAGAGWGSIQNNNFHGKVARALPSHGGELPGGIQFPVQAADVANMGMGGGGGGHFGHGGHGGHGGCAHGMCAGGMGGGMPGMGSGGPGPMPGANLMPRFTLGRTQVRFVRPAGMKIAWSASGQFTAPQLLVPARFNFQQARIYRLKLTDIENRPGMELYPTLEVYPGNMKVDAYLAHNAVPIEFTDEDFDQVAGGNFVTKVIYLPDAKYQELAIAGVETLVSTRLDPGIDPVQEASRRGAILAVLRLGGVDLEMPHSPELFSMPPAMGEAIPPTGAPLEPGLTTISDADALPLEAAESH